MVGFPVETRATRATISVTEVKELMQTAKSVHNLPMATTCAGLCASSWVQAFLKTAHFTPAATSGPNTKTTINIQVLKKNMKQYSFI